MIFFKNQICKFEMRNVFSEIKHSQNGYFTLTAQRSETDTKKSNFSLNEKKNRLSSREMLSLTTQKIYPCFHNCTNTQKCVLQVSFFSCGFITYCQNSKSTGKETGITHFVQYGTMYIPYARHHKPLSI